MPSFFRSSRRPLPTRSLVLCCALLSAVALDGCKTEMLHPADAGATGWTGALDPLHGNNVDILFVIDDSSDMALAQDNLIRNFPTFMATLQSDPSGPRNVHIAVLSQDMGAGGIAGCDDDSNALPGGKRGIFQYTARKTCNGTSLLSGATFISNIAGVANYTGAVEDVFGCIAPLGESGCGFNHQLAAVLRAFGADGHPAPAENQGFLRPEAALAIVMLTNEDDCSVSPGVPLFDTTVNLTMASQLGPPIHFRCNEFGHTCDGMHPNRNAPNNNVAATVTYNNCTSNDSDGYLLSTTDTANRIKSLKADPSKVIVASIQGSPTPYTVHWANPTSADTSCGTASCPWPEMTHACTASDGRHGDPGVRTAQFAQQFGTNGLVLSVCDGSFGPGLDRVAATINQAVGPTCIPGPVALDSAGQPNCKVMLRDGMLTPEPVPSCAASRGVAPCWQLVPTARCSPGQALEVSVDPSAPHVYSSVIATYDCAK